jgi:hypothetical protein
MLTPRQAESVAKALATRPTAQRGAMRICPACGAYGISAQERRRLSPFHTIQCSGCEATLRITWGRSVAAIFFCVCVAFVVWVLWNWSGHHHAYRYAAALMMSLLPLFLMTMQRLPIAKE